MSQVQTGNRTHDSNVQMSYGVLQAAISGTPTQAAVNAAYLTHYHTCLASAVANKCGTEPFVTALKTLGANQ